MSSPTIESLSAVVDSHTRQFTALHEEVANVGARVETLFGQLATKMDVQQRQATEAQISLLAGGKADYKGILVAAAAVATVFVSVFAVIGSMALSPIRESVVNITAAVEQGDTKLQNEIEEFQKLQQRRNLAMEEATSTIAKDVVTNEVNLASLVGAETERHAQYLRDDARHESRENAIDSALIKRPEIEGMVNALTDHIKSDALAANDRITSVIGSLNELRHDVGTNYTTGDALKSAFDRMDKFQTQLNALAQALTPPPMARAPLAPAGN